MTSVPLSMAMATNPMSMTGQMTGNMRPQLGQLQQVQVIHQPMHSPTFMPQFAYNQQQLMLQNMQGKGNTDAMYCFVKLSCGTKSNDKPLFYI